MLHAVGVELGIRNLEIDDGVDLHSDIILGDDGLGRKIRHLLLEAHLLGHPLDKGHLQVQSHVPHCPEGSQAFHHVGLGLLDDDDVADDHQQHQNHQNNGYNRPDTRNIRHVHSSLLFS